MREGVRFYAGFAGRICMVIICGARERARCRNDAERGCDDGAVEVEEAVAVVAGDYWEPRDLYIAAKCVGYYG